MPPRKRSHVSELQRNRMHESRAKTLLLDSMEAVEAAHAAVWRTWARWSRRGLSGLDHLLSWHREQPRMYNSRLEEQQSSRRSPNAALQQNAAAHSLAGVLLRVGLTKQKSLPPLSKLCFSSLSAHTSVRPPFTPKSSWSFRSFSLFWSWLGVELSECPPWSSSSQS